MKNRQSTEKPRHDRPTRWVRLAWIPGALLASLGLLVHAHRFRFVCDDAYISLRYAENLARHGALQWNLGERVEGYTNFLWTVLLAGVHKLGLDLPWAAEHLARLFGALGVTVLVAVGLFLSSRQSADDERCTPSWTLPGTYLAGLLTAATAAYAVWSSGGLETAMFTFLVTAGLGLALWELADSPRWEPSGLVLALATMTRPEGGLFMLWLGLLKTAWHLAAWLRRERTWSGLLRRLGRLSLWAGPFVLVYGTYFLWRWKYYGYLFPNTYYVKESTAGTADAYKRGWAYAKTFIQDYHLAWAAFLVLPGFVAAIRNAWKGRSLLLFAFLLWMGSIAILAWHVIRVGGDFMAMHRFWVPLVPAMALLLAEGLRPIERLAWPRGWGARTGWVLLLAALVFLHGRTSYRLGTRTLTTLKVTKTGYGGEIQGMESVAFMKKFADDRVLIGRFLRKRVPADAWIAVGGAGAIVFSSGLRAIDSFGLCDLDVAHQRQTQSSRPGHQKRASLHYILSRRPDIVCTPGIVRFQDWEYRPSPAERARWERRGYQYFCANPPGLRPSHYCCLMRIDRDLGLEPVSAYRF